MLKTKKSGIEKWRGKRLWLAFLSDPVFLTAVFVFIGLVAYVFWFAKREKERALKERLKQIEKKQEEDKITKEK